MPRESNSCTDENAGPVCVDVVITREELQALFREQRDVVVLHAVLRVHEMLALAAIGHRPGLK